MTYSDEVLADAPLGWWRGLESDVATVVDSSGNGHDGTAVGTVDRGTSSAVVSGKTYDFGGNPDRIAITGVTWLNTQTMTVEAWIKTTSNEMSILDRDDDASGMRPWQFRLYSNRVQFLRIQNLAGSFDVVAAQSSAIPNDGAWHHVVATYDGSTVRLYVDGVPDNTASAPAGMREPTTNAILSIGVSRSGSPYAGFFVGEIAEPAYYNTVLSAARILAHYEAADDVASAVEVNGVLPVTTTLSATVSAVHILNANLIVTTTVSATVEAVTAVPVVDGVVPVITTLSADVAEVVRPPENLTLVSRSQRSLTFSWDAPSSGPTPDHYRVSVAGTAEGSPFLHIYNIDPATSPMVFEPSLPRLLPNASYSVTVWSVDADGVHDAPVFDPNMPTLPVPVISGQLSFATAIAAVAAAVVSGSVSVSTTVSAGVLPVGIVAANLDLHTLIEAVIYAEGDVWMRWLDGTTQRLVTLEGWWDGTQTLPLTVDGWWDGTSVQDLYSGG